MNEYLNKRCQEAETRKKAQEKKLFPLLAVLVMWGWVFLMFKVSGMI